MDGSSVRSEVDGRKSRRRAKRKFLNVTTEDVEVVGVRGEDAEGRV